MITYIASKKKDPRDENIIKYYPRIVTKGSVDIEEIAARVARRCTVQRPDVEAAILAFQEVAREQLLAGNTVKLNHFGTFRVLAHGTGSDTPKDYSMTLIKKLVTRFLPVTLVKQRIRIDSGEVKFEKVKKNNMVVLERDRKERQ